MPVLIDRENYAKLLETFGLYGFPRRCGTPEQVIIGNPTGFFNWFDSAVDGEHPVFVAHNAYAPVPAGHPVKVDQFYVTNAFSDYDTGDNNGLKPEEVHEEVKRVEAFLFKDGVPHVWKASGSDGGFHLNILFSPEVRDRAYLSVWERALWRGLATALDLRSINMRCANPTCPERLPYTPYVHRKDPNNDSYVPVPGVWCVPLKRDALMSSLEEVRQATKTPLYAPPYAIGTRGLETLQNFVERNMWASYGRELAPLATDIGEPPSGPAKELNDLYIPHKLCLRTLPFGEKPKHDTLVAWAIELASQGLSLKELLALVDQVADEAEWVHRAKAGYRHSQTQGIWARVNAVSKDDRYKPWSCYRLRQAGLCLGKRCTLYPLMFGEEEKKDGDDRNSD